MHKIFSVLNVLIVNQVHQMRSETDVTLLIKDLLIDILHTKQLIEHAKNLGNFVRLA
jgi:hypothetical protein